MSIATRRFTVLFREFVAQLFASETATSDHHVRQAIIGVVALLLTPGLVVPMQLSAAFEFADCLRPEAARRLSRHVPCDLIIAEVAHRVVRNAILINDLNDLDTVPRRETACTCLGLLFRRRRSLLA